MDRVSSAGSRLVKLGWSFDRLQRGALSASRGSVSTIPHLAHLAKRFFQVVLARPLSPTEQIEVARWLRPKERPLFWAQQPADQRHGLATAKQLAAVDPTDSEMIRAGLLHDVGKHVNRIGAVARTWSSVSRWLGLKASPVQATYRDHGPIGGAKLSAAGAGELVVDFATYHPRTPERYTDSLRWHHLLKADEV